MKSRLAAVVFDFDLTLADSRRGFLDCHDHARRQLGLPPVEDAEALRTVGLPLPLAFRRLWGDVAPDAESFVYHWQRRADEVMTGLTELLAGAAEAVRALSASGLRLGIVSQKLRYRIEDVLRRDGLLDRFDALVGGDDVRELKPHPEGLLLTLQRLGVAPNAALYVGDTTIDAETAHRAGVAFAAVLTGETPAAEFAAYAGALVLPHVGHLPAALRDGAAAKWPPSSS
jgi:phosphoglycolate phosphatase